MNTTTAADLLARTLAENPPRDGAWDALDLSALSREGLVDALDGTQQQLAHIQARELRILATLAQMGAGDALDCTEDEVTAAVRWSANAARYRLHLADTLAASRKPSP